MGEKIAIRDIAGSSATNRYVHTMITQKRVRFGDDKEIVTGFRSLDDDPWIVCGNHSYCVHFGHTITID